MSTFIFLNIYIHMLMVITSEINHVVHRKLPNPILSIILRPAVIHSKNLIPKSDTGLGLN